MKKLLFLSSCFVAYQIVVASGLSYIFEYSSFLKFIPNIISIMNAQLICEIIAPLFCRVFKCDCKSKHSLIHESHVLAQTCNHAILNIIASLF